VVSPHTRIRSLAVVRKWDCVCTYSTRKLQTCYASRHSAFTPHQAVSYLYNAPKILPKVQAADLHKSYLLRILFSCLVLTLDGKCVKLLVRFYVSQIVLLFFVTSAHLHVWLLYILYIIFIIFCVVCIAITCVRVYFNIWPTLFGMKIMQS